MKKNKGITLISLVITIVIMLILATVSINLIIGNNGLFGKSKDSAEKSEIASLKEIIKNDILAEEIQEDEIKKLDSNTLINILSKYGTVEYNDDNTIKGITTFKGYHIELNDVYSEEMDGPSILANGEWNSVKKVNSPKLMPGMHGIFWDNDGNEVTVDVNNQNNWYDYDNQKWANAKTNDGSYWVWIPRFEYKIDNKVVNVKFISTSQTSTDSDFTYVHPAFKDGSRSNYLNGEWSSEIPGIWISKYEAGYQTRTTTTQSASTFTNASDTLKYSSKNYTCFNSTYKTNTLEQNLVVDSTNKTMTYPVFKPLTYIYNYIGFSDAYNLAREVENGSDFYGLNSSKTDSHMLKNSEWGAVVYLTDSKYGRNGIAIQSNNFSVNVNNNPQPVSDYSDLVPDKVNSSSTNNITGIYDLAGSGWEYVASYIPNGSSSLINNAVGVIPDVNRAVVNLDGYKTTSTKYMTVYPFSSSDTGDNNGLTYRNLFSSTYGYGDGINETSTQSSGKTGIHGDYSYYPQGNDSFFVRGSDYTYYKNGSGAGIYAYSRYAGGPMYHFTFRCALIAK